MACLPSVEGPLLSVAEGSGWRASSGSLRRTPGRVSWVQLRLGPVRVKARGKCACTLVAAADVGTGCASHRLLAASRGFSFSNKFLVQYQALLVNVVSAGAKHSACAVGVA